MRKTHANQSFIVLASASPRRAELLRQLGVDFVQQPADVIESVQAGESPTRHVLRLATDKCENVLASRDDCVILGSDTVVVADTEILGKPLNQEDHARMMRMLSGRTHRVCTAVVVMSTRYSDSAISSSEVTFRDLEDEEILRYWNTGEPRDKAGGYAIQGFGAAFVSHLTGSYSGVMGLPVFETAQLLERFGMHIWKSEKSI